MRLTCPVFVVTNPPMPATLSTCPYLPIPRVGLDWRTLHIHREDERRTDYYFACLEYGQSLWQRGMVARTLLCLDRAMGADLRGDEPVLRDWPLPYAAMAWCLTHVPPGVFMGNPRVHFQHYADRMNEPRREQRRWRAWACWALTRKVRPDLSGDARHQVEEPALGRIEAELERHGLPGEAALWQAVLLSINPTE